MADLERVLAALFDWVSGLAGKHCSELHQYLLSQFGQQAVTIIYVSAVLIVLAIGFKLLKMGVNLVRFVVLPALIIAYVAASFFSLSFLKALPVAGAACSALFLMRS
jgi:hypothetical protein